MLAAMVLVTALVPAQATTSSPSPTPTEDGRGESSAPAPTAGESGGADEPSSDEQSPEASPPEKTTSPEQPPEDQPPGGSDGQESRRPAATERDSDRRSATASAGSDVPPDAVEAMKAHRDRLAARGIRLGRQRAEPTQVRHGAEWVFKRGAIYWTRQHGAHAVWGAIGGKYRRLDGPRSVLGFPVIDERDTRGGPGRVSRFTRGRIFWSRGTGAHEIHGAIETRYLKRGGAGRFGLPTSDERRAGRTRFSVLQRGRIYWSRRTGARVVYGAILGKYLRLGGHRSWIGLPRREEFSVPGGRRAKFDHAALVWRRAARRTRVVKPFTHSVHRVNRSDVRHTYRSGCPVRPRALRRLRVVYTNFRGDAAMGDLIVRRGAIGDLVRVFRKAHDAGFHVRRIRPMNAYKGDDIKAMRADNTSAFNCRHVTGNPYRLSQHSYGNAIDINTFENPYVTSSRVYPAGARPYLNRRNVRKGMIVPGGVVARTMRNRGWPWGARWSNPDYQHFSANGG
jgi:hypothetical protein